VRVPALRDRREDVPLLVRHLVQHYAARMGKAIHSIPSETMQMLTRYTWPGNIRELQNVIERAVVLFDGGEFTIDESQLSHVSQAQIRYFTGPLTSSMADREKEIIEAALTETRGKISGPFGAAAKLGIPRQTLDSKIANLQISKRRFKSPPLSPDPIYG
jgi:formate hydrogenlyase transcriptional activator